MRAYLSDSRGQKIYLHVNKLSQMTSDISVEYVAQVIGYIVSSLPVVQYGALHYRWLEKDKAHTLKLNKGNFKALMSLCDRAKIELQWWSNNITACCNYILHAPITATVFSDASMKGWGAAMNDTSTGRIWSNLESTNHVNYLELPAAFLALRVYKYALSSQHVKIMIDHTAAVSIVNNMGTCRSDSCHTITVQPWEFCRDNKIWLAAAHLPGSKNVTADSELRNFTNLDTE